MTTQVKLFQWSKKIHRWLVVLMVLAALVMTVSGTILKFPGLFFTWGVNVQFIRFLHNQFSVVFSLLLLIMSVTGLYMYYFPIWQQRRSRLEDRKK